MKNCFGYVRVSSQKQGEGVSLDAQKDAILRFAEQNDIIITRWFEEKQTAAKSGRPVFNDMLRALKAGRAMGVVMHKIDRSSRNFFDWARIGELADSGIDVHFATESLDFRSRGGRLTANIQMAVAEDYVRNLRSEILKGQRGQLERGFYPFSAPFGYRDNGKRQLKTIDPVTGPLVKQAFELYGSGEFSLHSLRHELAKRGFTRPSGKPVTKSCIEHVFRNPFYAGVIHIRRTGEIYSGAHEPLVSPALFECVQQVKAGKCGKKVTKHNHLFRGLFQCGSCGRSMIPEKQKGHVYYRCQFPECPSNCVREEVLCDAVRDALHANGMSGDTFTAIDRWMALAKRRHTASEDTVAMQTAQINDRLEKLEDAAIEQIIDKDSFRRRKEKLVLEKAAMMQRQQNGVPFHLRPAVIRTFLELLKSLAQLYEIVDPPEKREIVKIALSNRRVNAKNVEVEPSNWLRDAHNAVAVLSCADARPTSRTCHLSDEDEGHLQKLAKIAELPEVKKLQALFMDDYHKAAHQFGSQCDTNCGPEQLAAPP